MKRLLSWLRTVRQRREQQRLALIAKAAELVIQQHSQSWSNRTCPNCSQPVSDIANFCQMCGHTFVQELQPAPEPVQQPSYEIERHTSSIHPIVLPPKGRITALIRTQQVPAQSHKLARTLQQQQKRGK